MAACGPHNDDFSCGAHRRPDKARERYGGGVVVLPSNSGRTRPAMANASPLPPVYAAPRRGSRAICSRSLRLSGGFGGHFGRRRKKVSAQAVAPTPRSPPINVDYLEREFGGHGATFRVIGDGCVVAMRLEGGGAASLVLPGGLITSYRPKMWHGSSVEVLHTSVSEGDGGGVAIQGGVSIDFTCGGDGEAPRWSPMAWDLRDVRGSPQSSIQVDPLFLRYSTSLFSSSSPIIPPLPIIFRWNLCPAIQTAGRK